MAQQVPSPTMLRDAVMEVVRQNISIGYTPTRFIQMTEGGNANNLVDICDRLIQNGETYNAVSSQLNSHPDILTLEDLVVRSSHGRKWELGEHDRGNGEGTGRGVGQGGWSAEMATPVRNYSLVAVVCDP